MKDSQKYLVFKSLELRHSPWLEKIDEPNRLENGTHRSFIIEFDPNFIKLLMLIHFKHLRIVKLTLYYRKKSAENKRLKKKYPQHKMRLCFETTLELLTYLSSKNYQVDWLEIRFKNGWAIKKSFLDGLEFITNNTHERNLLLEKLISFSGQGPIDINSLEINETYTLYTDGRVKLKPMFF
jgi:hypothetical protein